MHVSHPCARGWLARCLVFLSLGLAAVAALAQSAGAAGELRVGSKRFTESYILAEIAAQTVRAAGQPAQVRQGLGNTAIVYEALRAGQIDVYPEYTGTIAQEIVKDPSHTSVADLDRALAPLGLGVGVPLGFNNGYALAMRAEQATALGVTKLSDLARLPELKFGLSNEFVGRADGWAGLARRYGLPQSPRGLDHGLAYEALAQRQIDVTDIYTTDAQIGRLGLVVLADDLGYFPRYDAVLLYRRDLPQRLPAAWHALQQLEGSIDQADMIAMNGQAVLESRPFAQVAQGFVRFLVGPTAGATAGAGETDPVNAAATGTLPLDATASGASAPGAALTPGGAASAAAAAAAGTAPKQGGFASRFWQRLWAPDLGALLGQHLLLVVVSVGLATLIAVPLGIGLMAHPRARAIALGTASVLQTIPSLALLAVLIAVLGVIGKLPALIALTAYSVLPILSNTCAGLAEVPAGLRNAAAALGMTRHQRLGYVEFPLALPTVLAGVRTATAIAIGTATIAAFIGAGGLGERIVTGLALNDSALLLAGALPAAALALVSEALFELLARHLARRRSAPPARAERARSTSKSRVSAPATVPATMPPTLPASLEASTRSPSSQRPRTRSASGSSARSLRAQPGESTRAKPTEADDEAARARRRARAEERAAHAIAQRELEAYERRRRSSKD